MGKSIRFLIATVLVLTFTACETVAGEELKGRDIVTKGTVRVLSGKLKADGSEWRLMTDGGDYELHLGPKEYRESKKITMTDGATAEVRGFVFEKHASPISIKTAGSTLELRTEAGVALWGKTGVGSQRLKKEEN